MKYFTVCLYLLVVNLSFSQQYATEVVRVEYERNLTPNNSARVYTGYYALNSYPQLNISIFDKTSKPNNPNEIVNTDDDDSVFYYTPSGKNVTLVYKDYNESWLFNKKDIAFKYFIIKDSLNIFNWNIEDATKEILGYTCQLAKMNFRGRNYKAWFTTELPQGGPWKYDGLPGMILEMKTENKFISFEAVSIKRKKIKINLTKIENPFIDKPSLSWQEFKKLYKEKAIALSKYSTTAGNEGSMIMPRIGIERYIDENDNDYKADKEFFKQQEKNKN